MKLHPDLDLLNSLSASGANPGLFSENTIIPLGSESELLKLIPYGIQLSADGIRPMLLLKDEKGELTMPVGLNPLEAGVALTQSNKNIPPTTPHKVTELILGSLNISIERAVFTEIKGPHQIVQLQMKGHPQITQLSLRAEDVMSLCLHLNVPMYATKEIMLKSRELGSEVEGAAKSILAHPEVLARSHRYIM